MSFYLGIHLQYTDNSEKRRNPLEIPTQNPPPATVELRLLDSATVTECRGNLLRPRFGIPGYPGTRVRRGEYDFLGISWNFCQYSTRYHASRYYDSGATALRSDSCLFFKRGDSLVGTYPITKVGIPIRVPPSPGLHRPGTSLRGSSLRIGPNSRPCFGSPAIALPGYYPGSGELLVTEYPGMVIINDARARNTGPGLPPIGTQIEFLPLTAGRLPDSLRSAIDVLPCTASAYRTLRLVQILIVVAGLFLFSLAAITRRRADRFRHEVPPVASTRSSLEASCCGCVTSTRRVKGRRRQIPKDHDLSSESWWCSLRPRAGLGVDQSRRIIKREAQCGASVRRTCRNLNSVRALTAATTTCRWMCSFRNSGTPRLGAGCCSPTGLHVLCMRAHASREFKDNDTSRQPLPQQPVAYKQCYVRGALGVTISVQ
eukprot:2491524-Rhodomonas_salina.2